MKFEAIPIIVAISILAYIFFVAEPKQRADCAVRLMQEYRKILETLDKSNFSSEEKDELRKNAVNLLKIVGEDK